MTQGIRATARIHIGKLRSRFLREVFRLLGIAILAAVPVAAQNVQISPPPSRALDPETVTTTPLSPLPTQFTPMTREQRWQDYKQQNFESPGAFFQTFFAGLGNFAGDVPPWDSGALGFSEHIGSEFARFTIAGTIRSSLAATLHQDTRYFHCTCQGGFRRTMHAVGRTLLTYNDEGSRRPDISGLAGIYGGSILMTYWYPARYTPWGYGVRQGNIAVGITTAIYVIREFSPDIKRAFRRRGDTQSVREP